MTFLELRQRIAEELGLSSADITPDANATLEDKFKAWVNARYKVIAGKRQWNWRIKDTILQTYADITTGTITANQDSTTITFSSAPSISVSGWFIQFSDTNDWYEISSHTAGNTSAILTHAYLGSNSSTLTYTLRKNYYSLPSDLAQLHNIRQTRDDVALRYVPIRQLDRLIPDRTRAGEPEYYTIVGLDSAQNYRVELYPVPSARMNLNVRYYCVVDDMVDDDDTPLIPESFHDILVWDVLGTYGYTFLDDTRLSAAKAQANDLYEAMVANEVAVEDIPVRLPYDFDNVDPNGQIGRLNLPIES